MLQQTKSNAQILDQCCQPRGVNIYQVMAIFSRYYQCSNDIDQVYFDNAKQLAKFEMLDNRKIFAECWL